MVFLGDILIYSANQQNHAVHLEKLLENLREHQLSSKARKCEILKTSIEVLGQQICNGGMTPTEAKLKAVQDWAVPRDIWDVSFFLVFTNYYQRFVRDLIAIARPLTSLK